MKYRKSCIFLFGVCLMLLMLACSVGGFGAEEDPPPLVIDEPGVSSQPPEEAPPAEIAPSEAVEAPPPADDSSQPAGEFEGRYNFTRMLPDGSSKDGKLKISEFGAGYKFDWGDGVGLGLKSGDVLAVAAGEECGVVLYEIQPDQDLSGKWMGWSGNPGSETMSPNARGGGDDLSGGYVIEGKNPDRSQYTGTVKLSPLGSLYSIYWETGGGSANYSGIALAREPHLAVSYGSAHCVVYFIRIQPDGSLQADIGLPDGSMGKETAVRK